MTEQTLTKKDSTSSVQKKTPSNWEFFQDNRLGESTREPYLYPMKLKTRTVNQIVNMTIDLMDNYLHRPMELVSVNRVNTQRLHLIEMIEKMLAKMDKALEPTIMQINALYEKEVTEQNVEFAEKEIATEKFPISVSYTKEYLQILEKLDDALSKTTRLEALGGLTMEQVKEINKELYSKALFECRHIVVNVGKAVIAIRKELKTPTDKSA